MTDISMIVRELLGDRIAYCPIAPEEMRDETELVDGLGMDSMEKIEIAISLEEVFAIEISDAALDEVKTVGDLVALVDGLHTAKERA